MTICTLCNQLEAEKGNPHARLFCKATGGSFSTDMCKDCRGSVGNDFYSSLQATLLEVDSWTRNIYPNEVIFEIAQEALDILKKDYSSKAIEERMKTLNYWPFRDPNTHSHRDSAQERTGKRTPETITAG